MRGAERTTSLPCPILNFLFTMCHNTCQLFHTCRVRPPSPRQLTFRYSCRCRSSGPASSCQFSPLPYRSFSDDDVLLPKPLSTPCNLFPLQGAAAFTSSAHLSLQLSVQGLGPRFKLQLPISPAPPSILKSQCAKTPANSSTLAGCGRLHLVGPPFTTAVGAGPRPPLQAAHHAA